MCVCTRGALALFFFVVFTLTRLLAGAFFVSHAHSYVRHAVASCSWCGVEISMFDVLVPGRYFAAFC